MRMAKSRANSYILFSISLFIYLSNIIKPQTSNLKSQISNLKPQISNLKPQKINLP